MPEKRRPLDPRDSLITLGRLALDGSFFDRPKPLLLLAYLCLEGRKTRRHLAELFWPRAANGLSSLSTELSRVGKALGAVFDADETTVQTRLNSDAQTFLETLGRQDFGEAIGLYTGSFLEGVEVKDGSLELTEWVYSTREFLAARMCEALLELGERAAAAGDFGAAARRAEAAWNERLTCALDPDQLSRAYTLLRADDHPFAARVEEEANSLGLSLVVSGEAARKVLRSQNVRRIATPNANSFIGRVSEVGDVTDLLRRDARLVTVVGLAGIGKSRLAAEVLRTLQAGDAFADGIHPVWLVALTSPEEVPDRVAAALGVELGKGADAAHDVADAVADKRILLYLDNFEHVMESGLFVSDLLIRCPNLRLLVSSRERLNLGEEWAVWLDGLPFKQPGDDAPPLSEAAQLFLQRAKRVDVTFSPTEKDLNAAEEVGRRVQGSPLAIELAASWTRALPWAEIAAQLGEGEVLSTTLRDVPERHRSIGAAFERSWQLLSDEEQRVLRELSVFRGGFSREAAKEVVGAGLSTLVSLVDKSLLKLVAGGRFGRHPLLYEFTKQKLDEHLDEGIKARNRHAAFYLVLAEKVEAQLLGEKQTDLFVRLESERDNIRVALRWLLDNSEKISALRLIGTLENFWIGRGYASEVRAWLLEVLPNERSYLLHPTYARAYFVLGQMYSLQGDLLSTQESFFRCLEMYERLEDLVGKARVLNALGTLAARQGEFEVAQRYYEEGLELWRIKGDKRGITHALNNLGILATRQGRYEEAQAFHKESLTLRRALADKRLVAASLSNLSELAYRQGDYGLAREREEEGLVLERALGNTQGVAMSLNNLSEIASKQGDYIAAQIYLTESLQLKHRLGDKVGMTGSLHSAALLASSLEQNVRAVVLLGAAEACRKAVNISLSPPEFSETEYMLTRFEEALETEIFTTQINKGRAMSLEEAVAFAQQS